MVKIEWTEAAIKDLEKLDRPVIQRILRRLTWFANNFEKAILEPLEEKCRAPVVSRPRSVSEKSIARNYFPIMSQ